MSRSDVTREGVKGASPGREALTGKAAGRHRRRRRGGEEPMVPKAKFSSYYGKPVLNKPTWKPMDIAGYLFLGGLAGGSSALAAGAQATGRPGLARAAKAGAFGAISLSLAALVHDLGRPARFLNMLRVFKPTSPMSVGSWLLSGYAPLAAAATASDLTGRLRPVGTAATAGAAALGPAVAAYTAVLLADTAAPSWHEGYRELPFAFVGSGASAAGGLGMLAARVGEAGPARRMAAFGTALELAAIQVMKQRMGIASETFEQGKAGRLMHASEALSGAGAVLALTAGRRSRVAAAAAGTALLCGSAALRFGVFHAGVASTEDPKYVVVPQRERLDEAERQRAERAGGA